MARPRKNVEGAAPQEQPVHDPEAERQELVSEAQESAPESEQSEPSSEGSGDEEVVAVMANPDLRAARVRVRDASGKEYVVETGTVIHVPSSAYDRNPTYLNKV
jgi:hypothetical protein